MSWKDEGLYWAWLGSEDGYTDTPTKKKIHYADIPSPKMRLAIGVWDDDKYKELNRVEYAKLVQCAKIGLSV
jgi:hypothetical protein